MKQFFHYLSFGFTLCLLLAGCKSKQDAPLLEGSIQQANLQELSLVYDLDGEVCVETITTDSIGHFAFYGPLKCPATDVVIYAGSDLYGAYLEKGKQVRMQITADEVQFEGDHVDRCRWNNTYHQAFYVLLDAEGKPLNGAYSYNEDVAAYTSFLREGLTNYKASQR